MDAWCEFCVAQEKTGDIGMTPHFHRFAEKFVTSRMLGETKNFAVIAGMGQLVEGYILILSKKHFNSMAYISSDLLGELSELSEKIRFCIETEYATPLIFEHGSVLEVEVGKSPAQGGGMCIDHAHFHYIPLADSRPIITSLKSEFSWHSISELSDLEIQARNHQPYIFVQASDLERLVFKADSPPSQYMRRLIAQHLGIADKWNWATHPEPEKLALTVNRLKKYFED